MMGASNIHYEMAEKGRAVNCGGIGAIHLMVNKLGLRQEIDSRLHLLKKHLPYHESDHVLNLTYNALLDGVRLEDIELRRNDEAFLDGRTLPRSCHNPPLGTIPNAKICTPTPLEPLMLQHRTVR